MVFWQLNSLISTSVAWNIVQYKKILYVGRPVVFVNMNAIRMTELTKLGPVFKTLIRWIRITLAGQSYTICRRSNQLTTFQQREDPTTGLQVLIKATAFGVSMLKRYTKAWSSNTRGGTEQNWCTRPRVKWMRPIRRRIQYDQRERNAGVYWKRNQQFSADFLRGCWDSHGAEWITGKHTGPWQPPVAQNAGYVFRTQHAVAQHVHGRPAYHGLLAALSGPGLVSWTHAGGRLCPLCNQRCFRRLAGGGEFGFPSLWARLIGHIHV